MIIGENKVCWAPVKQWKQEMYKSLNKRERDEKKNVKRNKQSILREEWKNDEYENMEEKKQKGNEYI